MYLFWTHAINVHFIPCWYKVAEPTSKPYIENRQITEVTDVCDQAIEPRDFPFHKHYENNNKTYGCLDIKQLKWLQCSVFS